jgi:spore maturation protein CgeB
MKIFGLDYGASWFASCKRGLEKNGHEVRGARVRFNDDQTLKGEKGLIEDLRAFGPDFVLIYNFMGMIPCLLKSPKGGAYINSRLFTYLMKEKIPCAAWFLDDPLQSNVNLWIIRRAGGGDWLNIFCCDRAHVAALSDMGIRSRFLAHCTDPEEFRPLALSRNEEEAYACPVSFVGESKVDETRQRRALVDNFIEDKVLRGFDRKKLVDGLDESIEKLIEKPALRAEETTLTCLKEKGIDMSDMRKGTARWFYSIIEWLATSERRVRLVRSLLDQGIVVYGDRHWPDVIPEDRYRGPIDYRCDTVKLYHASEVNLNVTRSQIRTAVTQRIFDVSATGAFLLTDYREDFDRYFEPGTFVFYDGPKDLGEKTAYYLAHPGERRSLADTAMRIVREKHTYENRMKELVRVLASEGPPGL